MAVRERRGVKIVKNLLIPMSDDVHLAADLRLPEGDGPFPTIVTFMPYHKGGRSGRQLPETAGRHFAARGYAALTLDFRGLGNSGGVNPYPFDRQERLDGHEAVEWIAAQPWCSGSVGMWGVSYGGITALSVASTRPPHLRAIVPIHASIDLYHDFVHLGGCRSGFWSEGDWGARMIALNLLPPLYQDDDGRWAEVWREHLEGARAWILSWHEHPEYDDFWAPRATPCDQAMLVAHGNAHDPRLANANDWLLSKQDAQGRWMLEHGLNGKMWIDIEEPGKPSKWITLRALRVLKAVG
jgi:predicted acyl esterase